MPGTYWLVLEVNGQTYKQSLIVTPDPRIHISQADFVEQFHTAQNVSSQMDASYDGYTQVMALRNAIDDRQKALASNTAAKDATDALKALDEQVAEVGEGKGQEFGIGALNRELARYAFMIESGDAPVSAPLAEGVQLGCQALGKRLASSSDIDQKKIGPVNDLLGKYNLAPLPVASNVPAAPDCSAIGR